MRRNLVLLFVISLLFLNIAKVNAEIIECEYPELELTMSYDTEEPFDKDANPFIEMGDYDSNSSQVNLFLVKWGKNLKSTDATEIDQSLYKQVLDNYGCPTGMHVCTYVERAGIYAANISAEIIEALFTGDWDELDAFLNFTSKLVIMTDKEYRDSYYKDYIGGEHVIFGTNHADGFWNDLWDFAKSLAGWGDEPIYAYRETVCDVADYDGPYIGININCTILKNKIFDFIQKMIIYKDCGEEKYCKSQALFKVREAEDGIKAQCRSILEGYNYEGGEAECVDACLNIKDTLDEYKAGTDLAEEYNSGQCGFSARLLVWINNILRWVKYILPVLVIILSILNFIKAIGADKDDEMKKAQKKFIIRLIAAALVFLIPLIIEFILNKMGFGYDSCGLF